MPPRLAHQRPPLSNENPDVLPDVPLSLQLMPMHQFGACAALNVVLEDECQHVRQLRHVSHEHEAADASTPQRLSNAFTGLALSGGGIRSATFSFGVLPALAQRGRIRQLD